jgi:hypothetical protein
MKLTVHLTIKNLLSIVIGTCVVGLAVIPLKVDPNHLAWLRWEITVYALAAFGVLALMAQAVIQSKEDHEREKRELERDQRQVRIEQLVSDIKDGKAPMPPPESIPLVTGGNATDDGQTVAGGIDSELDRIFTHPRVPMGYEFFKDIYRAAGRKDEPKVDCDVLAHMYVVNTSNETIYIRDLVATVEVDGVRTTLETKADFLAGVFNDTVEYGWEEDGKNNDWPTPLPKVFPSLPYEMVPRKPAIGWIRFLLKEINPEKIDAKTFTFTFVDSTGKKHDIDRTVESKLKGVIGLRRLR